MVTEVYQIMSDSIGTTKRKKTISTEHDWNKRRKLKFLKFLKFRKKVENVQPHLSFEKKSILALEKKMKKWKKNAQLVFH
jgi:hypothetical protein